MPTDENNGVNPQNQQVNPTSWDSDDFDFSFDDSNTDQSWSWLSWDMQDQMRRQWRSGMFLTPDEAMTKSSDDNDMSLWNIDISSTVQPQQRSGMFLTPDEEANKEESQIEWKQFSFQWAAENQAADSDDSYLAWIDPGDVEDSQDWSANDWQQETPIQDNDYSQDKLDDEIEDLISFWDEPKADNVDQWPVAEQTAAEPKQVSQPAEEQTVQPAEEVLEQPSEVVEETTSEAVVEQPLEQNVELVEQPEQAVEAVESNNEEQNNELNQDVQEEQSSQIVQDSEWDNWVENTNIDGNVVNVSQWSDSEDRLSQEDKKVEESFWTASEFVTSDIDVSPESVGQNVENVINESVDSDTQNIESNIPVDANMDAVVQPTEQNDLHIENMGTDVVENWNWDLISDTWWMQQMEQENTYVPNEAEFNQMSDILNSSSTGQIDLSNLNTEQSAEQQVVQDEPVSTDPVVENTQVEPVAPTMQGNITQSELENNVNDELLRFWWVDLWWQVVSQEIQPSEEVQSSQETQPNVVVENPNNTEINLDSLVQDTGAVNQEDAQNNVSTWSLIWAINEWEAVEQNNQSVQPIQPVQPKKKKKQSWFTVLWIFVWVIALLGLLWFAASKMFPDKFANIFKKNNLVTEYLLWDNDENNVDENNPEEINPDDIDENNSNEENPDDVENSGNNSEVEEPDPDSLAWLLEWNENSEDSELSWDVENSEINNWDGNENFEASWDWNGTWEDVVWWDNGTWDFDPFAWIDEILWEAQEYIDRLNSYVASWQYYIDWWESNWNDRAKSVWSKVIEMAQAELTKLENWGEIDTTAFDRIDDLLKKLSSLVK